MPEAPSLKSRRGKLVLAATVLGSGVVFLESTVVMVAAPAIAKDLHLSMAGLQWVMDAYLLTLSALILTGGALGDAFGRGRIFVIGAIAFGVTSALAAFVPNSLTLIGVRLLQGAAGALLVPNSLAVIETVFTEHDRGRAIGQWAGWSAASTALGPVAGGWLVDATSWRWVFGVVAPVALSAAALGAYSLRGTRAFTPSRASRIDYLGAVLATVGLAGITAALILGPVRGFSDPLMLGSMIGGVLLLAWFVWHEAHAQNAMLPLTMFRSHAFVGTNAATLFIYAALSGLMFLLMLQLQDGLGYSAFKAGVSLLPLNMIMLVLSPIAGRLSAKYGARWFIMAGAIIAAIAQLLYMRVKPGASYAGAVLPATVCFGLGLGTLVAPLTTAMMESAKEQLKGVASAFNNAVSRVAGLLATAIIPLAVGIAGQTHLQNVTHGFAAAMMICAGLCLMGGLLAGTMIGRERRT